MMVNKNLKYIPSIRCKILAQENTDGFDELQVIP